MVMTTWSRLLFCTFIVPICIWFLFLTRINNTHQLTNQQHSIDVDSTRICIEFLSTFGSLITNIGDSSLFWSVAVKWGKWRARPRPCMTSRYILLWQIQAVLFTKFTERIGRWGASICSSSSHTSSFSKPGSCWVTLAFSPIPFSSFVWCIKLQPISSVVSSLSIVAIDWCNFEVRDKSDDNLVLFIQIMRDINLSMIAKTKMSWNLKYVISKFKDEHWDNKKSRKNNKKGLGGW